MQKRSSIFKSIFFKTQTYYYYVIAYVCHSNSHFSIYAGTSFYYFPCSFQKADATSQKSGHQDVQYLFERCLLDAFIVRNYKKEKRVLENITGRHLHDNFY